MKKILYSLLILLIGTAFAVDAQRYLSRQFQIQRTADVAYGANIGILTGAPTVDTLLMDVYTPVGDTETDRPVILIAHTGSFLPQIINGQATGSRLDSTVTRTAGALASMGYVVAAYTYRQGWLPTAPEEDVRRGTLLQAAYRGIQDTRTCVRYFRKSADSGGNPWGINPDKIGVWGIGTGGYLALGAGTLDDWDEITLSKFINTQTATPYIDSTCIGNFNATTSVPPGGTCAGCLANHPGYSSDIQVSVNVGGAMGDESWIDGNDNEPVFMGFHCVNDIFAPYYRGPVIVPTTNEFVVNVTGTRRAVELANTLGSNDILQNVPAAADPLRPLIELQKQTDVTLLTMETIKMGTDNFYGFNLPFPQGSPWDWWGYNDLTQVVGYVNSLFPGNPYNADTIHLSGLATNPTMSGAQGRAYLDTIFGVTLPRMCIAFGLGCFDSSLDELDESEVGLVIAPNPATTQMTINTKTNYPIEAVYVYDLDGRLVKADVDRNTNSYILKRHNLPSGNYVAQFRFKEGYVSQKIVFQ